MAAKMIVPVSERLSDELISAERLIEQLNQYKNSVNDRDYFTQTAEQLAALTMAVLDASTSRPLLLTGCEPMRARFDMGAGTTLAHHVSHCVTYLRDEASPAVAHGAFSMHGTVLTTPAADALKELHGLVMAAVIRQAEEDLRAVRARSAAALIVAANAIAAAK